MTQFSENQEKQILKTFLLLSFYNNDTHFTLAIKIREPILLSDALQTLETQRSAVLENWQM